MADPTPEAVAKAYEVIGRHDDASGTQPHKEPVEWCTACRCIAEGFVGRITLALDDYAQAQAHQDCHPAALCDGPKTIAECRIKHLAELGDDVHDVVACQWCGLMRWANEALEGEGRARILVEHLEQQVAEQAQEIARLVAAIAHDVHAARVVEREKREQAVAEAVAATWEAALDLMATIEGEIAADTRHTKEQITGAHMLGATVRARAAKGGTAP